MLGMGLGILPLINRRTGGGGAWNPDSLGIPYWDASDLGSMFTDAAGASPVVGNGDPVGMWASRGVTGLNMTQTSGHARPQLRQSPTTGLWWIEPDGVDDWLAGGVGPLGDYTRNVPAITIMVAGRKLTAETSFDLVSATVSTGTTAPRMAVSLSGNRPQIRSRRLDNDATAQSIAAVEDAVTTGANFTLTAEADYQNRRRRVWADGALLVDAANVGTAGNTSDTSAARTGVWSTAGGALRMQNRIYAVAIANRVLSDEERNNLRAWMQQRIET